MVVETIFPTPMYINPKIDNFEEIQEEIQECYDQIEFERFSDIHWISPDPFRNSIIRQYGLTKFENMLKENVMLFSGFQCRVTSSWFSLFKTGDFAHVHNHGFADIAGAYYFKTKGVGDIFFQDPTPGLGKNAGRVSYGTEEGRVLMFPGWLYHGVTTNTDDEDRVSISFNILIDDPSLQGGFNR